MFHRYKRIFSIGSMGITTYNPGSLEVTNRWEYSDFISVQPTNRNQMGLHEFSITMRKERKVDTMKFSSEHRSYLLTEALRFRNQFAEKPKEVAVRSRVVQSFIAFISYACKKMFLSMKKCVQIKFNMRLSSQINAIYNKNELFRHLRHIQ